MSLVQQRLEFHHRGAPGKAGAESIKQHDIARLDAPLALGFIQRHRYRCRRGIAVLIDIHDDLFHRYAQAFGQSNDDTFIGLMRNDQRNLVNRNARFFKRLRG